MDEVKDYPPYLDYPKPYKAQTNADRIRAMSDEELAAWIAGMSTICECCAELNECASPRGFKRCSHGVKDWLQQPAGEEDKHEAD